MELAAAPPDRTGIPESKALNILSLALRWVCCRPRGSVADFDSCARVTVTLRLQSPWHNNVSDAENQ